LPYPQQLAQKRGRIVSALSRFSALQLTYTSAVEPAQPITRYRTRAKLIVGANGAIGLYARGGGHQLVDIEHCQVLAPAIARTVGRSLRQKSPTGYFSRCCWRPRAAWKKTSCASRRTWTWA
jgi:tRNA/tmRNA/rRNA uracil-C5-methylase (TrmA/RlmC/RlmD family)